MRTIAGKACLVLCWGGFLAGGAGLAGCAGRQAAEAQRREESFQAAATALKDGTPAARAAAAADLGRSGDPRAVPLLLAALPTDNLTARKAAVLALGNLRAREARPDLFRLVEDPEPEIRSAAVTALGRIGAKEDWEILTVVLLKDESAEAKSRAAFALGDIKDPRAIPSLIDALEDRDAWVRWLADAALFQTTRQTFHTDWTSQLKIKEGTRRWREWWGRNRERLLGTPAAPPPPVSAGVPASPTPPDPSPPATKPPSPPPAGSEKPEDPPAPPVEPPPPAPPDDPSPDAPPSGEPPSETPPGEPPPPAGDE